MTGLLVFQREHDKNNSAAAVRTKDKVKNIGYALGQVDSQRHTKTRHTMTRLEKASGGYVICRLIAVLPYNSRITSEELWYFKSSEEKEVTQDYPGERLSI